MALPDAQGKVVIGIFDLEKRFVRDEQYMFFPFINETYLMK